VPANSRCSIFLVKFSVLFLCSRFARTKGILLHLRTTQTVCAATAVVCVLSLSLSCTPISDYWSVARSASSASFSSFSAYHCAHRTLLTYASGIGDVVTNALVLLVPIPLLLRIPLARAQKAGLSVLYLLGATVVLTSALRFAARLRSVSDQQAMGWSLIETALALLLASAPPAVGLLVLPLVDVDAEREVVLAAARRGAVSSASVGTPVFVRKLLDERDAMAGGGERSSWQVRFLLYLAPSIPTPLPGMLTTGYVRCVPYRPQHWSENGKEGQPFGRSGEEETQAGSHP